MSASNLQTFIQQKASERKVKWSRHALGKLAAEPITVRDVERALQQAEVIEEYPGVHRYLPDCLVLAYVSYDHPVHCVIGVNEPHDYILVVTVYLPKAKEWESDWRTRK